jgi:hypothetical protein
MASHGPTFIGGCRAQPEGTSEDLFPSRVAHRGQPRYHCGVMLSTSIHCLAAAPRAAFGFAFWFDGYAPAGRRRSG